MTDDLAALAVTISRLMQTLLQTEEKLRQVEAERDALKYAGGEE